MKRIILLFLTPWLFLFTYGQDSTKVRVMNRNVVTVVEDSTGTKVKVGENSGVFITADDRGDTTRIRIGRRVFDVIEADHGTEINVSRKPKERNCNHHRLNGQWAGIGLSFNMFRETDFSDYNGNEFFDLNYGKSLSVDLNFAEMTYRNDRNTFGLVTGMGLRFMDFRFDQPVTIEKDLVSGRIMPVYLNSDDLKKSKLSVSYLTVPLLLEVATPLKFNAKRLTISAGVIGGLNIGSHTKIKYTGSKDKDRGNFNISPLKYELTGRIGLGDVCLFANYGMTPLFKEGKGPRLMPLMVGISFPNI